MRMQQVGTGRECMELARVRSLASVMAEQPSPGLSGKYTYFSTFNILEALAGRGWLPTLAQEQRVVKADGYGFQKHMIRLRQADCQGVEVGELVPELVITNSHNGLAAAHFLAAIWRKVCANGLMVSQSVFGEIKLRHIGFHPEAALEAALEVSKNVPQIMGKVNAYAALPMSQEENTAFAQMAVIAKYAESDTEVEINGQWVKVGERQFDTNALLTPIRHADNTNTLFGTFNVVQEKLIKGDRFERNLKPYGYRRKTARGVQSINENVRLNRTLFSIMDEVFTRKSASTLPKA